MLGQTWHARNHLIQTSNRLRPPDALNKAFRVFLVGFSLQMHHNLGVAPLRVHVICLQGGLRAGGMFGGCGAGG